MSAAAVQQAKSAPAPQADSHITRRLRIRRSNPSAGEAKSYSEFDVEAEPWTTVLDVILEAKKKADHSIGVRYSCRQATCGSCGMMINGKPRLACFTKVNELDGDTITVEPMQNFPVVRDLVVGFDRLFRSHHKIKPYIISDEADITEGVRETPQTPEELDRYIQFAGCIKCGLCNSACPTMATDSQFIGPQSLAQVYRYVADTRDHGKDERLKIIDDSHGIWRCHYAGSCSKVCPKGVDPAMGIQLLKGHMLGP